MQLRSGIVACGCLFGLIIASAAAAEPVSVTSGFVQVTSLDPGPISIAGTRGFSFEGIVSPSEGSSVPVINCWTGVCLGGETLSLESVFIGSAASGTASLDGQSFELTGEVDAQAGISLTFSGVTTLPDFTGSPILVTAPFTLVDSLLNIPPDSRFGAYLQGGGIVSLRMSPVSPNLGLPEGWVLDELRYDFNDAAAPVPEPGTVMLVGAGLAAGLRGRWRRVGKV